MTIRRFIMTGAAMMALAVGLQAQTTTKTKEPAGAPTSTTTQQMTGEVIMVDGNNLLVRMEPNGIYRIFTVKPDRQFMIDGQPKHVGDLKPGTTLTASVITHSQPVTLRTTTVTNGTVWYVSGNQLIVTLENGENKSYNVPESYRFTVDGKLVTVHDLRKGMHLSGTKMVAEPSADLSTETVVTGKAPR